MKIFFSLMLLFLPFLCRASAADSAWLVQNYTKKEVSIKMRDGIKLYTIIYEPKNHTKPHPILINRTPYSIAPYGDNVFKAFWNSHYIDYFKAYYIIVLQDVRGKYMSEGEFMDVRPFIPNNDRQTDEASDTYDTIEWLITHVKHNNRKVGIFGISYPGYYATMGALCGHPALKVASPQAPVTEWFLGDDFHHNGAFMEMDGFNFYSSFGKPRPIPAKTGAPGFQYYTRDNYKFYLEAGPLKNLARLMGDSVKFWKDLYDHPNYDQWWQNRNTRKFVKYISKNTATLVVGGLFDAEDCYGAWNLYKSIENDAHNNNKLVMGPWSHGGWARGSGEFLGNARFGKKNSEYYQKNIEEPFFAYYLEGKGNIKKIKEANIFFSGVNEWRSLSQWPPANNRNTILYFNANGKLNEQRPAGTGENFASYYTSDPAKPVPYAEGIHFARTKEYMTDDQRFAAQRPDVLVYQTDTLPTAVTLGGAVIADLYTTINTTDVDFVVKLIDVFPDNFKYDSTVDGPGNGRDYTMGGYQMLVRGEIMRGRYRNSFSDPAPFVPGKPTEVRFELPDVAHVFKKGHRIMVQVQSTWFPLADRNPQQFVDIYHCDAKDFIPCDVQIHCDEIHPSAIILPILYNN
ncbi:MAG: CocE/NonD family hydrolase [Taibaiella sp.]|nr:CocE/NonD family hydrolase [Taibaiella sp.]